MWRICSSSSIHVETTSISGSTGSVQSVSCDSSTGSVQPVSNLESTMGSVKSSTSSLCITSRLQAQNSRAEEEEDEEAESRKMLKGIQLSHKMCLLLYMSCFSCQVVRNI
ncbi:hypothetical protein AtEden1_Chr1g0043231 [Arabidopsis thaliana]